MRNKNSSRDPYASLMVNTKLLNFAIIRLCFSVHEFIVAGCHVLRCICSRTLLEEGRALWRILGIVLTITLVGWKILSEQGVKGSNLSLGREWQNGGKLRVIDI